MGREIRVTNAYHICLYKWTFFVAKISQKSKLTIFGASDTFLCFFLFLFPPKRIGCSSTFSKFIPRWCAELSPSPSKWFRILIFFVLKIQNLPGVVSKDKGNQLTKSAHQLGNDSIAVWEKSLSLQNGSSLVLTPIRYIYTFKSIL